VSEVVGSLVAPGRRTAILAIDPTSPLTGGAILGDRIRMGAHTDDPNIFIRSLASRGHLGGISTSTPAMAACLDGLGFDEILVETVGVGQSEVEIASSADTTVVVVTAGWGDAVQAAKAGFLEVADIFVVNKADRGGADSTVKDIEAMLDVGPTMPWRPPVIETVASEGIGVSDVSEAIVSHREFLVDSGRLMTRRRLRAAHDLAMAVRENIDRSVDADEMAASLLDAIVARRTDPWTEADRLLESG
jgi:LAO/AO transport system kinase